MNALLVISGIIIALYALYCGLSMWMAQHVVAIEKGEEPMRDEDGLTIMDHLPKSHLEIIKHYYMGMRGIVWRLAFVVLLGSLGAFIANSALAVYLFGTVLAIDCALFLTYEHKKEYLSDASKAEKSFDILQYSVLLAAFLIMVWRHYSPV